ncbi:WSC domain-containing protein [Lactarius quietus]|nr:WSC domain-containing protein [Lactarius quietus]
MTVENCITLCQNQPQDSIYAGVENGTDCYCGSVLTPGAVPTSVSNCTTNCVGNSSETCGGSDSLDLYWNGQLPSAQPRFVQSVGFWAFVGCFNDSTERRTLTTQVSVPGGLFNNTVENCVNSCQSAGYSWAGVEFAQQCWCDKNIENGGVEIEAQNCFLACSGNSSENCGGPNTLDMYFFNK